MFCQFAREFPPFAAELLDRGARRKRAIREDTITDLFVAATVPLASFNVFVDFSEERRTGADMEWWFYSMEPRGLLRIIVQAKKIHGKGANWKRLSYRELAHPDNSGRQFDDLVAEVRSSSVPTYLLYAFYNTERACSLANSSSGPLVEGVSLADGRDVGKIVADIVAQKSREARSLKRLRPLFFPLTHIFCRGRRFPVPFARFPAGSEAPIAFLVPHFEPPTPMAVRDALVEQKRRTSALVQKEPSSPVENGAGVDRWPQIPQDLQEFPSQVEAEIQKRIAGERSSELKRHRLLFVSGSFEAELARARNLHRQ